MQSPKTPESPYVLQRHVIRTGVHYTTVHYVLRSVSVHRRPWLHLVRYNNMLRTQTTAVRSSLHENPIYGRHDIAESENVFNIITTVWRRNGRDRRRDLYAGIYAVNHSRCSRLLQ